MHCSCVLIVNKKAFQLLHVGNGKLTVPFFFRFLLMFRNERIGEKKNYHPHARSHRPHINKCFNFSSVPRTFFSSLSTSL